MGRLCAHRLSDSCTAPHAVFFLRRDTLQGRLEHLQRARNCLNTLHTFDREPQRLCPRWEGAAARGAAARGDAEARAEGLTAADGGAALREVYGEVAAHVAGECTYKTCNCLAARSPGCLFHFLC